MSRTIVVTGAARGIGAAVAAHFLAAGDDVVVLDPARSKDSPAGLRLVECDIREPAAVAAAFEDLERVDVLVNNAGIQRVGLVGRQPVEEWMSVIDTNLNGAFFCASEALGRMPDGGAIVSIASTAAFVGLPGRGPYSAAKAALLALTRVWAVELASRRIRVNAVCPGFTRTALVQQGIDDGSLDLEWMMQRVPFGRMAEVEEIARAVGWLAGPEASYVTGQSLVVDGGWTVQGINAAPDWLTAS